MWISGIIRIVVDYHYYFVHFSAKVLDEPSEYGIFGGRISKLSLKIDDVTVCSFDCVWDIAPTCLLAKEALKQLLYMCDGKSIDAEISCE